MHQGRMRLIWLSALGLAFLCLPAAASDDPDSCAPGQLLGKWFILGIGSNCEWLVQFLVKEIMTANISSKGEGSFTIDTRLITDYGSMDIEMTYTKQENGIYLHKSEWGDKIIERKKTDCTTYAMTCVKDEQDNDGKFCKFVSLYGRAMSAAEPVRQAFLDFAVEMQLDREQIFFLTKKDAAAKST